MPSPTQAALEEWWNKRRDCHPTDNLNFIEEDLSYEKQKLQHVPVQVEFSACVTEVNSQSGKSKIRLP